MLGFNGGLIGGLADARDISLSSAVGVWTLNEQRRARLANLWPVVGTPPPAIGDAYEGGFFAGYISHTDDDGVATHALIVAPRANGASGTNYPTAANLAWQSSFSATGATSPFNGASNTALMTNSLAANFCTGLSIGGYSDWYLPARYELDIAYENLKPTTTSNNTSWGINEYSVPERTANRTAGAPARTSLAAFQTGGAQAFVDAAHWSSTEDGSSDGRTLNFSTGAQTSTFKFDSNTRVRAFRRVAL